MVRDTKGAESDRAYISRKKAQIEEYIRDDGKLIAAAASSVTKKRRTPTARAMQSGDITVIKRSIYSVLLSKLNDNQRKKVYEIICNEYNYCNNRNNIAEMVSGVYLLCVIFKPLAIPVCHWVFLLKYRFLDELCDCKDREIPNIIMAWVRK